MTESNDDKREYDGLGRLPEDCSEAISAACERVLSGDRFASAIDFLASKAREAAEQTDSAPQGTWQWSAGRIVACLSSALLQQLEAVATLRAERDELAKENEGLRLTVKHCLNGQKWLRCEIEAIAEKAESTTGTRDGAYYRALIWIRERARAALNRGDTE